MDRIIFHLDMDAFYASVEEQERPELRGKPVIIGADPKQGRGRGVVSTANYVARQAGIHSAMPIMTAWRLCPEGIYIRPTFQKYKSASQDVMEVLESYADVLQVVGMDEAYLDVSQRLGGDWNMAASLALSLQAAVHRATGLHCSVGVAAQKSVAKVASDHRKPHGVTVVPPSEVKRFLDPLPVRVLHGCGPKTAARLNDWDIFTGGDLAEADSSFVRDRFGSHGEWLQNVAHGLDDRPVVADRGPRKSRGNERTFGTDQTDMGAVRTSARKLLDGLLASSDRRAFATLTAKIRYSDFTTLTRAHTLSIALEPDGYESPTLAHATLESLLEPLLDGRAVRLVGVRLSGFQARTGQQRLQVLATRKSYPNVTVNE